MISIISFVICAWRALLYVRVSLFVMDSALSDALRMAMDLCACSQSIASRTAQKSSAATAMGRSAARTSSRDRLHEVQGLLRAAAPADRRGPCRRGMVKLEGQKTPHAHLLDDLGHVPGVTSSTASTRAGDVALDDLVQGPLQPQERDVLIDVRKRNLDGPVVVAEEGQALSPQHGQGRVSAVPRKLFHARPRGLEDLRVVPAAQPAAGGDAKSITRAPFASAEARGAVSGCAASASWARELPGAAPSASGRSRARSARKVFASA